MPIRIEQYRGDSQVVLPEEIPCLTQRLGDGEGGLPLHEIA